MSRPLEPYQERDFSRPPPDPKLLEIIERAEDHELIAWGNEIVDWCMCAMFILSGVVILTVAVWS